MAPTSGPSVPVVAAIPTWLDAEAASSTARSPTMRRVSEATPRPSIASSARVKMSIGRPRAGQADLRDDGGHAAGTIALGPAMEESLEVRWLSAM
jgi:hypothetical protein